MDTISAVVGAKETHNRHLKYNAKNNKLQIWKIYWAYFALAKQRDGWKDLGLISAVGGVSFNCICLIW